jgi:hypothetical protein
VRTPLCPLFVAPLVAVLAVSTFASPARAADDKAACVSSYEQAQDLRRQNKLRAAREQLLVCTRDACPKLVRSDCTKWMEEVTNALPSVGFAVHDAKGADRTDAKVIVDGEALTGQLGQVVPLDPGVHKVRVEAPGAEAQEQDLVVRAGEKNRIVTVTLAAPASKEPVTVAPAPAPAPAPPPKRDRPRSVVAPVVLGSFGVAAVGVGAYLAISGSSQLDDLRSTCAPHCNPSDVDALNLRNGIAFGAIGAGVVSIGAAAWLFFRRPAAEDRVNVGLSPRGVVVGGHF